MSLLGLSIRLLLLRFTRIAAIGFTECVKRMATDCRCDYFVHRSLFMLMIALADYSCACGFSIGHWSYAAHWPRRSRVPVLSRQFLPPFAQFDAPANGQAFPLLQNVMHKKARTGRVSRILEKIGKQCSPDVIETVGKV